MDVMTPIVSGGLLAVFTLVVSWLGKGRFDALERQNELLRAETTAHIDALRAEMNAHVDSLRSDILAVALAVGAKPQPQTG